MWEGGTLQSFGIPVVVSTVKIRFKQDTLPKMVLKATTSALMWFRRQHSDRHVLLQMLYLESCLVVQHRLKDRFCLVYATPWRIIEDPNKHANEPTDDLLSVFEELILQNRGYSGLTYCSDFLYAPRYWCAFLSWCSSNMSFTVGGYQSFQPGLSLKDETNPHTNYAKDTIN